MKNIRCLLQAIYLFLTFRIGVGQSGHILANSPIDSVLDEYLLYMNADINKKKYDEDRYEELEGMVLSFRPLFGIRTPKATITYYKLRNNLVNLKQE